MRKRWINIMFAVFAVLFFLTASANATNYHYYAYVYKYNAVKQGIEVPTQTETSLIKTGITYQVLTTGTNTAATLYSTTGWSTAGTSKTNPVTTTVFLSDGDGYVGRIDFWTTTSTVDLIVVNTAGGYTAFVYGFSPNQRSVVIDETPNIQHHGCIWYNMASTAEISTGVVFPIISAIDDVRVEVVNAGSAATTIGAGLLSTESGGSATGFLSGRLVSTAGFVADTAFITAGSALDYVPVTTYGTFLATAVTGTGLGTPPAAKMANGGITKLKKFLFTSGSAKTLSYTTSSADGSTKGGYLHYWFTRLR